MLRMASPISGATGRRSIFRQARTASGAAMLSVMTSFSMAEEEIRATAPPESTPWTT